MIARRALAAAAGVPVEHIDWEAVVYWAFDQGYATDVTRERGFGDPRAITGVDADADEFAAEWRLAGCPGLDERWRDMPPPVHPSCRCVLPGRGGP